MIHLELPFLPPSVNQAYANIRGTSQRILTKEGRAFKTLVAAHLAQNYRKEMQFWAKNKPYLVVFRFWLDQIENNGYPKRAENRYKRVDVSNRVKLLEDALKDAGAFDDSQTLTMVLQKQQVPSTMKEKTEIWAWDLEEEKTPFDPILTGL